jgi:N-acetyl-gamma-glutamyl-phosphate reductase
MKANAAVLGASGYSGAEVLRYLLAHPGLEPVVVSASSRSGEAVADVLPHLRGAVDSELVPVEEARAAPVDVLFSCLPSGELAKHLHEVDAPVIVDLADDHRADPGWVYGLTEFQRAELRGASRIANPGCYSTAALLATVPFARAGLIDNEVIVDAISGVSGAGRKLQDRLLMGNAASSAGAYGTTSHRHLPEIERGLACFGGLEPVASFTPHLAPMERGLVATVRAGLLIDIDDAAALTVLRGAYAGEPFVEVVGEWPQTKALAGTNRAHVSARVDAHAGWLIASSAIDNLGKGAAGQALQNANLALGIEETSGLESLGVWP